MYKPNQRHLQPLLISTVNDLPEKHRQRLETSWAGVFYREFFCRIAEEPFAVLFADCPSRPNIPVNVLVGLETLKAGFGWSDEELYEAFLYNLQVRYALGYRDLHEGDFELRTLYNFRQRLSRYNQEHGVNLLTQAFEQITAEQIGALQLRTGKLRMDSTQIASNIQDMSRLQLLVETLQRLYRLLTEADQARYAQTFAPYLRGHSGQYAFRVKGQEATYAHLQQLGGVLHRLLSELKGAYGQEPVYQVARRFFAENFRLEAHQPVPKANAEIGAGCLQSLDDLEASFRRKGNRSYKGYSANLSETCDAENEVQLIAKVQVAPNNREDSDLLVEALPDLKARTGVESLYTDGAYASPEADQAFLEQQVEHIPSGIRGVAVDPERLSLASFEIQQNEKGQPTQVCCPQGQCVPAVLSDRKSGYRADFAPEICQSCPLQAGCPARPGKRRASFRLTFLPSQVAVSQRRRRYLQNKKAPRNLRSAIESTVRDVKHPFPAGKLPVRGLFRVTCLLIGSAAMTNIRRIQRYRARQLKQVDQKRQALSGETQVRGASTFSFFVWLRRRWAGPQARFSRSSPCFSC